MWGVLFNPKNGILEAKTVKKTKKEWYINHKENESSITSCVIKEWRKSASSYRVKLGIDLFMLQSAGI